MTDDPVVLLREAADKATPGPWKRLGTGVYSDSGHRVVADMHNTTRKPDERSYDDADCVATFRNHLDAVLAEVVRLRAQVEAVKKLHKPEKIATGGGAITGPRGLVTSMTSETTTCAYCSRVIRGGYEAVRWPCATIRALGGSNPVADAIDARIRNGSTGERRDLLAGYVEQEPDDD